MCPARPPPLGRAGGSSSASPSCRRRLGAVGRLSSNPGAGQAGADVAARRCPLPTPPPRPALSPVRLGSVRHGTRGGGGAASPQPLLQGRREGAAAREAGGAAPVGPRGADWGGRAPTHTRPRGVQRRRFVTGVCPEIPLCGAGPPRHSGDPASLPSSGERARRKTSPVPRLLRTEISKELYSKENNISSARLPLQLLAGCSSSLTCFSQALAYGTC